MVLSKEQVKNKLNRAARRRAKAHARRERQKCFILFCVGFVVGLVIMNSVF